VMRRCVNLRLLAATRRVAKTIFERWLVPTVKIGKLKLQRYMLVHDS